MKNLNLLVIEQLKKLWMYSLEMEGLEDILNNLQIFERVYVTSIWICFA